MKKYFFGLTATIFAIYLNTFTPSNDGRMSANSTYYFFKFVGTHGQEGNSTKWEEITDIEYDLIYCIGANQGCALISTAIYGYPPFSHPYYIPLNANNVPVVNFNIVEVKNKN